MSTAYEITNEWLEPALPKHLYSFYLAIIVNLELAHYQQYKLYPGVARTIEIQKAEVNDILLTETRVNELETIIMNFASNEIGLAPLGVYLPHARIQYRKSLNCLFNLANNWQNYVQLYNITNSISNTIDSDEDVKTEYEDKTAINNEVFKILSDKMKETSLTIQSMETQ